MHAYKLPCSSCNDDPIFLNTSLLHSTKNCSHQSEEETKTLLDMLEMLARAKQDATATPLGSVQKPETSLGHTCKLSKALSLLYW